MKNRIRETIEAERNMSEKDRAIAALKSAIEEVDEFENWLGLAEDAAGLQRSSKTELLPNRLRRLGVGEFAIARQIRMYEALDALRNDGELPNEFRAMVAERTAAMESALQQLQTLMNRKC